MKTITISVIALALLIGCSKTSQEPQSQNIETNNQENIYPSASLQEDGTIILYTKDLSPKLNNKEIIAEYIFTPDSDIYKHLQKQLGNARVGVRLPVKNFQSKGTE